jgi:hypothetical protein
VGITGHQGSALRLASPQDNGGHEQMHADISGDVQAYPAATRELQQRALTKWQKEFNHVRPHEALGGKVPSELYKPSVRRRLDPTRYKYPEHWIERNVIGRSGVFGLEGQLYLVGRALTGYIVALEPLAGLRHRIWFRDLDLGEIEIAPPRRLIDSAVDCFLERPFRKTDRPKRPRNDFHATDEAPVSPSAGDSQLVSLPPGPPQLPLDTCSQQTLGSSAVSSAATQLNPA